MNVPEENSQWPPVDTLVATLLYLTSRFALSQDLVLIRAIDVNFSMLERHPETSSALSKTSHLLREQWLFQLSELELSGDDRSCRLKWSAGMESVH